jgi:hypothetical protein
MRGILARSEGLGFAPPHIPQGQDSVIFDGHVTVRRHRWKAPFRNRKAMGQSVDKQSLLAYSDIARAVGPQPRRMPADRLR